MKGGIIISKIPFLYGAYEGKNGKWRYLITIISTWGVQLLVSLIFISIFFISLRFSSPNLSNVNIDPNDLLKNGLFILTLSAVAFSVSFFVFYLFTRFIHYRKFISYITVKSRINWMRILKGATIWLAILGAITVITFLFNPGNYKVAFNPNTFGILLILSLITFPIQASFEEVFFRGYLMQGFGLLSKKPIIPLIATSIIFGSVHALNGGSNLFLGAFIALDATIVGLMFGIITLGENSIETAMGIHIINNMYVALIVSDPEAGLGNLPSIFITPTDPVLSVISTVIAILIAITIIFWNKKDKLFNIFRWEDI